MIFENGIYREETPEELAQMEHSAKVTAAAEKNRPLTEAEVSRMLLTQQVNSLAVDDNTAVRMMAFYPSWSANTEYAIGCKAQYDNKLWRVLQAHTSQNGWEPVNTPALWEQISETHDGTIDDPITYNGNMALQKGLYYYQGGGIYLCVRDTVNPVYQPLKDLVGLYVEVY